MFKQSLALTQSKSLRFTTLSLLHVCQGLPIGVFQVALPAWFAAERLSVSEIGGFVAIVFLPWSFKLLAGSLMDRFAFPPIGRRRPWILLAKMRIIGSFLLIAVLSPNPKESYYLLAALIMAFAVFFVMVLPRFLRERPAERLVPWSTGETFARDSGQRK